MMRINWAGYQTVARDTCVGYSANWFGGGMVAEAVNPEGCIMWLSETATEVAARLRASGLLT
jgi:hypothetical protein